MTESITPRRLAEVYDALGAYSDVPAVVVLRERIAGDLVAAVLAESRRAERIAHRRVLGAVPPHKRRPVSAEARQHISEALRARNARLRAEAAAPAVPSNGGTASWSRLAMPNPRPEPIAEPTAEPVR